MFDVGDVVRCVNDKTSDKLLTEGRDYVVIAKDGGRVVLNDVVTRRAPHSWMPERFSLQATRAEVEAQYARRG